VATFGDLTVTWVGDTELDADDAAELVGSSRLRATTEDLEYRG
jgi:hypothetical protein